MHQQGLKANKLKIIQAANIAAKLCTKVLNKQYSYTQIEAQI